MKIFDRVKSALHPNRGKQTAGKPEEKKKPRNIPFQPLERSFSLGERPIYGPNPELEKNKKKGQNEVNGKQDEKTKNGFKKPKKPRKLTPVEKPVENAGIKKVDPQRKEQSQSLQPEDLGPISASLEVNLALVKKNLHLPHTSDIIVRDFTIGTKPAIRGAVVFVEGLASRDTINTHILQPLMLLAHLSPDKVVDSPGDLIRQHLLPANQLETKKNFKDAIDTLLMGVTLVFIDGEPEVLVAETKGWEHRTVGHPTIEQVVIGPHEAFTELLRTNTALIRRRIRSPHLIVEALKVGRISQTDVALIYLADITNDKLVAEVRRRLQNIDVDYLSTTGQIEQYIEDNPFTLFNQMTTTELPDRAAAALSEGQVVLVIDGSPHVALLPIVYTNYFQAAEDYYLRGPFGSFSRFIRGMSIFFAIWLPSIYVAATTFHPEMIPTPLMLTVAASRENVPFPVFFEVIMMELALELIREAGIRIPSTIGPTIGIVGALILGQAAVAAGIVSPILIIVVAMTALAAFVVPDYSSQFAVRLLRFPMTVLAAMLGFVGTAAGTFVIATHLASLKSFGVPFLSPWAPSRKGSVDLFWRGPLWLMERRPEHLRTKNHVRQAKIVRKWALTAPETENKPVATDEQPDKE